MGFKRNCRDIHRQKDRVGSYHGVGQGPTPLKALLRQERRKNAAKKKLVDQTTPSSIAYGVESVISPISKTENVMIDRAFISEKNGLRLRTIKECLVICVKDVENKGDRKRINKEVRAKYHKALKYWNE